MDFIYFFKRAAREAEELFTRMFTDCSPECSSLRKTRQRLTETHFD